MIRPNYGQTITLLQAWVLVTDKFGWLYFDVLEDALLGAHRLKAMGYAVKLRKNPDPIEVVSQGW